MLRFTALFVYAGRRGKAASRACIPVGPEVKAMKLYSTSRVVAVAAIALGTSTLFAALPIAGVARATTRPAINCAGLPWTYHIGPRVLPMAAPGAPRGTVPSAQPTPKPGTGHVVTGTAIAWPASILRGIM